MGVRRDDIECMAAPFRPGATVVSSQLPLLLLLATTLFTWLSV